MCGIILHFYLLIGMRCNAGLEDNLQSVSYPEELPVVQIRQVEVQLNSIVTHLHNPRPREDNKSQHNQNEDGSCATAIILIVESHILFLLSLVLIFCLHSLRECRQSSEDSFRSESLALFPCVAVALFIIEKDSALASVPLVLPIGNDLHYIPMNRRQVLCQPCQLCSADCFIIGESAFLAAPADNTEFVSLCLCSIEHTGEGCHVVHGLCHFIGRRIVSPKHFQPSFNRVQVSNRTIHIEPNLHSHYLFLCFVLSLSTLLVQHILGYLSSLSGNLFYFFLRLAKGFVFPSQDIGLLCLLLCKLLKSYVVHFLALLMFSNLRWIRSDLFNSFAQRLSCQFKQARFTLFQNTRVL